MNWSRQDLLILSGLLSAALLLGWLIEAFGWTLFLATLVWAVLQQLGDTHVLTLVMGVVAFAIMWGMRRYVPRLAFASATLS